eukprot:2814772-Prorocentrum_lima.AAC.1
MTIHNCAYLRASTLTQSGCGHGGLDLAVPVCLRQALVVVAVHPLSGTGVARCTPLGSERAPPAHL